MSISEEIADYMAAKRGKTVTSFSMEEENAPLEIEYRYLLQELPENISDKAYSTVHVSHAYLAGEVIQERFSRREYSKHPGEPPGKVIFTRTVKIGHGVKRYEFEDEISKDLFEEMNTSSFVTHLNKIRHHVVYPLSGGIRTAAKTSCLVIEVDEFKDRELLLAEIEIPSVESKIFLPRWLSSVVIREVTSEREYEGVFLAK